MENFIYVYKKALSRNCCQDLINLFEKDSNKYKGPLNNYCKTNNIYFYKFIEIDVKITDQYNTLMHLFKYKSRHKFLGSRAKYWGPSQKCNLQKYQPSQSYSKEHCEHEGNGNSSSRILGWMFYLNDIYHGGQTVFPNKE